MLFKRNVKAQDDKLCASAIPPHLLRKRAASISVVTNTLRHNSDVQADPFFSLRMTLRHHEM